MGDARKHNTLFFEHNPADPMHVTRECTPAEHVFTSRQTSEFQVSNIQVFPPNREVLLKRESEGR